MVAGTATFNPGSTYLVEVDPTTSDLITANAATITGGTVAVSVLPGNYAPVSQYTIVTTAAGVTGQFSGVTINTPLYVPTLTGDANNVYLTLSLNGAAGEIHASLLGGFIESDQLRMAALERTESALGDLGTAAPSAYAGSALLDPAPVGSGLWGRLYGGAGTLLGKGTVAALSFGEGGVLAGTDAALGEWRLGVIGGAGFSSFAVPARNSTASSTDLSLALYGGGAFDPATVKFGAGYTRHFVTASRTTGIPGATDVFSTAYPVDVAQAFAEINRTLDLGAQEVTPFAGITAIGASHPAFTESGGAAALSVAAGSYGALVTDLGVRLSRQFTLGEGVLATAKAAAGWRHVVAGDPSILANFAGGPGLLVAGTAPAADSLLLSGELALDLPSGLDLDLAYRGRFAPSGFTNSATATLAGSF